MKRLLLLSVAFAGLAPAQTISISAASKLQTIDCFGAAEATAGGAALNYYIPNAVLDTLFSPSQIGLSCLRVSMYSDLATCVAYAGAGNCVVVSSGATTTVWELAAMQHVAQYGVRIWASSPSPPASMKANGVYAAGGGMIPGAGNANYTTLAADYAAFPGNMAANGITIYAFEPQNEPDQCGSTPAYPQACWSAQQIHDFIPYLSAALRTAGYPGVRIIAPNASAWETTYLSTAMNDATVAGEIGIVGAHSYSGVASALTLASLANVTNQHLWEGEYSTFDTYDGSITNAIGNAQEIWNWLISAGVSAWHYWLASGFGYTNNEGLTDGTGLSIAKRAYAIGNWSRFVRPDWSMINVGNSTGLFTTAFVSPNGRQAAIVLVNNSGSDATNQAFNTGGFQAAQATPYITSATYSLAAQAPVAISNGAFSYTIPANSIVTLFMQGAGYGSSLQGVALQRTTIQ